VLDRFIEESIIGNVPDWRLSKMVQGQQDSGYTGELFELSTEIFERLLQGAQQGENQRHNSDDLHHVCAAPPKTQPYQADCGELIEAPVIPDWRDR